MATLLRKLVACLALVVLALFQASQGQNLPKIKTSLQESLRSKEQVSIFVAVKNGGTIPVLRRLESSVAFKSALTHAQRTTQVSHALKAHAETSQKPVLEFIQRNFPEVEIRSFWIVNQIYLKNVTRAVVEALASLDIVSEIQEEQQSHISHFLQESSSATSVEPRNVEDAEWGLQLMRVPEVWEMEGGNKGEGIIIGNIDTGVRGTHELLRSKWVGLENNGWYDPEQKTPNPHDVYNHGKFK
jgi:hypothetical protein